MPRAAFSIKASTSMPYSALAAWLFAHEMRFDVRQAIRGRRFADALEHLRLDVGGMHVTARADDLRRGDREEAGTAAEIGHRGGFVDAELAERPRRINVRAA